MGSFNSAVMTNAGAELLAQALAGTATIEFTSTKTGNGEYSASEKTTAALQQRTALKSEKQSFEFSGSAIVSETGIALTAVISNEDVSEGYYINEVGIYARNSQIVLSVPILYSIAIAEIADYLPPYNGTAPTTITQSYYATVSNSASVQIVIADGSYSLNYDDDNSMLQLLLDGEVVSQADIASKLFKNHNSIYRGKYLGDHVTEEQYAEISAGTFKDLYIGDYWTIDSVTWRIAAFDYWLGYGDTACTTHHVLIVPDECLDDSVKMNDTNVTTGGYVGSKMYTTYLTTSKNKVNAAFGAAHILSHREYFTNAVTSGYPSAGAWYDSEVDLMRESMVYGSDFFTPHNSLGATIPAIANIDHSQLPLFAHDHSKICNRANWWLRDVVSASNFASVNNSGNCGYPGASNTLGVRPAFAIKA